MPAENPLTDLWRILPRPHHQINQSVAVTAVQPKCNLRPGHGDLLDVLRELDLRLPIDLHQLVDTAESGLSLAGHQVGPDTKTCDLVALLVQREDRLLVDIIGGRDHHGLEPLQLVLLTHPLHGLLHHPAEVGQVAGVNADTDWFVTVVMQGHRHSTEVEETALGDIVCVDQSHKVGRKSDSEADEGSQLPVMSLANKNVEELSQLFSPLHT